MYMAAPEAQDHLLLAFSLLEAFAAFGLRFAAAALLRLRCTARQDLGLNLSFMLLSTPSTAPSRSPKVLLRAFCAAAVAWTSMTAGFAGFFMYAVAS
jgi:hypothetical protein